jgi:hypothetical protein
MPPDLETKPTLPGRYSLQAMMLSSVPAVSPIRNAPAWGARRAVGDGQGAGARVGRRCCRGQQAGSSQQPRRAAGAVAAAGPRAPHLHAADGGGADEDLAVGARVRNERLGVLLGHALGDDGDHLDRRLLQRLHGRLKRAARERGGRGARWRGAWGASVGRERRAWCAPMRAVPERALFKLPRRAPARRARPPRPRAAGRPHLRNDA